MATTEQLIIRASWEGRDLEQGAKKGKRAISDVEKATALATRAFIALGGAMAAQRLGKYADSWTNINNKLRLVTDSTEQLRQRQGELFQIAQATRSEYESTVTLYSRLKKSTDTLNASDADRLKVTKALTQAFIVSGASSEEAANATRQLGQGLAMGALRSEEFNSVNENGQRIMQALKDSLGETTGGLREMANTGKLTTETVFTALLSQAGKIDAEFQTMDATIGGAATTMANAMLQMIGKISEATGVTNLLADAMMNVAKAADEVSAGIDKVPESQRTAGEMAREEVGAGPSGFIRDMVAAELRRQGMIGASAYVQVNNIKAQMAEEQGALQNLADRSGMRLNVGPTAPADADAEGWETQANLASMARYNDRGSQANLAALFDAMPTTGYGSGVAQMRDPVQSMAPGAGSVDTRMATELALASARERVAMASMDTAEREDYLREKRQAAERVSMDLAGATEDQISAMEALQKEESDLVSGRRTAGSADEKAAAASRAMAAARQEELQAYYELQGALASTQQIVQMLAPEFANLGNLMSSAAAFALGGGSPIDLAAAGIQTLGSVLGWFNDDTQELTASMQRARAASWQYRQSLAQGVGDLGGDMAVELKANLLAPLRQMYQDQLAFFSDGVSADDQAGMALAMTDAFHSVISAAGRLMDDSAMPTALRNAIADAGFDIDSFATTVELIFGSTLQDAAYQMFTTQDALEGLTGALDGVDDAASRATSAAFDLEEMALRQRAAAAFSGAGGDVAAQSAAWRDFLSQLDDLARTERLASSGGAVAAAGGTTTTGGTTTGGTTTSGTVTVDPDILIADDIDPVDLLVQDMATLVPFEVTEWEELIDLSGLLEDAGTGWDIGADDYVTWSQKVWPTWESLIVTPLELGVGTHWQIDTDKYVTWYPKVWPTWQGMIVTPYDLGVAPHWQFDTDKYVEWSPKAWQTWEDMIVTPYDLGVGPHWEFDTDKYVDWSPKEWSAWQDMITTPIDLGVAPHWQIDTDKYVDWSQKVWPTWEDMIVTPYDLGIAPHWQLNTEKYVMWAKKTWPTWEDMITTPYDLGIGKHWQFDTDKYVLWSPKVWPTWEDMIVTPYDLGIAPHWQLNTEKYVAWSKKVWPTWESMITTPDEQLARKGWDFSTDDYITWRRKIFNTWPELVTVPSEQLAPPGWIVPVDQMITFTAAALAWQDIFTLPPLPYSLNFGSNLRTIPDRLDWGDIFTVDGDASGYIIGLIQGAISDRTISLYG